MKYRFSDLSWVDHRLFPGALRRAVIEFPNFYAASVINGELCNGGDHDLYEVGIMGPDGKLCYDTPLSDDVIAYLSQSQVEDLLNKIAALPLPRWKITVAFFRGLVRKFWGR